MAEPIPEGAHMRNPRTNPFGRHILGIFNYRTQLNPPSRGKVTFLRALIPVSFWAGLTFGGYYLLKRFKTSFRYEGELQSAAVVGDRQGYYKGYREHTETMEATRDQLHYHAITPYDNRVAVRQEYVFGNAPAFTAPVTSFFHHHVRLRLLHEKHNSLNYRLDPAHNSHRYIKAKPKEEYDALRLKALFNLSAAAYHEGRAPNVFIPLETQIQLQEVAKSSIV